MKKNTINGAARSHFLVDVEREMRSLELRKKKLLRLVKLRREVSELEVLAMSGNDARRTLKIISEEVSAVFHLSMDQLFGRSRVEAVAKPRQVVFYLARMVDENHPLTYHTIGKAFGRDHGTVICGQRAISDRIQTDARFGDVVKQIKAECQAKLKSAVQARLKEIKPQIA